MSNTCHLLYLPPFLPVFLPPFLPFLAPFHPHNHFLPLSTPRPFPLSSSPPKSLRLSLSFPPPHSLSSPFYNPFLPGTSLLLAMNFIWLSATWKRVGLRKMRIFFPSIFYLFFTFLLENFWRVPNTLWRKTYLPTTLMYYEDLFITENNVDRYLTEEKETWW